MSARRLWPVLALAAVLGLANLVATPAFWPVDETSHVAYADVLMGEGRLPEISDPIPHAGYPGLVQRLAWERDQYRFGRQDVWTANHPPLPYVIQGLALAAGRAVGRWTGLPQAPLVAARLTSVAWLVAGVWATMRLAFLLAGQTTRRGRLDPADVAVVTGTLVAVTPTLTHLGGLVFNDVPAFTLSTACLLLGAQAAFAGVDRRRLAGMGLVAGAAALTRVSCLPAIAVMVVLGLYGWWRDPARMPARQAVGPVSLGAVALLPAAAFWIRNIVRYGDLTASGELLAKFDRDLNDPVGQLLVDRFFWLRLWNRMWGDLTTGHWAVGPRAWLTEAILVVVLAAVGVAVLRGVLRQVTGPGRRTIDLSTDHGTTTALVPSWIVGHALVRGVASAVAAHPRRVVWGVGSLLPLGLLVSAIQFHSAGGSLHGRYVLGGHALTVTAIVVVVGDLPRIGRWLAVALVGPAFTVQVALVRALVVHGSDTWDRTQITLALPSVAGRDSESVVSALLVAAGVILLGIVVQHGRPRPPQRQVASAADGRPGRYGVTPSRSISASAAR